MSLFLSTTQINKVVLNTTQINKAYLGASVLWGSAGSGFDATAFVAEDVAAAYSDAFCELYADGTALVSGNVVATPASPKWWATSPPATWVEYSSTGNGTIIGGLTAGIRYQLNTARKIGIEWNTVGTTRSRTFTLSFYDAASGGTLVGTKTFTATVEVT
jgi:hypothetical protein